MTSELERLRRHLEAVEANRDELLQLLLAAHRIMDGPGTTDEKLRKAGRHLGLLDPHRPKKDWQAIADRYWKLRWGTPPDEIGGPVDPVSMEKAEQLIAQEFHQSFDSIVKAWQRHGIKVKTGKRHPTYKDTVPNK